jgi:voltage-gated potassium channel
MLGELRQTLHAYFMPRRHTSLLVLLIALFAARPLSGNAGIAPFVLSLAMLGVLLAAIYAVRVDELVGERDYLLRQRIRRNRVVWLLAVPALLERVMSLLAPSPAVLRLGTIFWLLVFAFVTLNQLRSLLRQKEVTGETISMAISVYLLLGVTWGLFFILIFLSHPQAFNLGSGHAPVGLEVFPTFLYFSLATISTIGYGDITPLSLQARFAAVAEGIAGQFYLAVLVARLVAMQMSGPPKGSAGQ